MHGVQSGHQALEKYKPSTLDEERELFSEGTAEANMMLIVLVKYQ